MDRTVTRGVRGLYEGRSVIRRFYGGMGVVVPAGNGYQSRLHLEGQKSIKAIVIVLPQETVSFVAQEVSKPYGTGQTSLSYIPSFNDPLVMNFALSAVGALKSGAPDFYAQASAQWLAAHLLLGSSKGSDWHRSLARERISDPRLIRVLEYIDSNLSDDLDLRLLSREAGISQFHFAALFSKAVGMSPHRHVQHLRMQAARSMLCSTDKSALEIALTCGFKSASHFASVFRKQFSQSPTEFRSSHRPNLQYEHLVT